MIKIDNLSKNFGAIEALKDVSFSIEKGEITALLGPNGAGKSTLMKIMVGYVEPDKGEIDILGKSPVKDRVKLLQSIGYVPENTPLYNEMSVFEFLSFVKNLHKKGDLAFVVEKLKLHKVINQRIETLSKGFRKRVGIAAAILHNPEVLILDEPTEGLDPEQKEDIREFIKEYSKNTAVLISTHVMEEVEAVASKVLVLNKGGLIANTTLEELKKMSKEENVLSSFLELVRGKANV
jgi:ABC-2 type transport system ATP-binding protein